MANLGDMVVRIVGDNAELDAAIDKSKKKTQDFLNEVGKIGKTLSVTVTAPIMVAVGLAIKSFAEAEAATKRLSGAIQLAGTFTRGATERLSAYATGLMKTTGVSDELIRNLMAQAVAMGRTEEEAKKLADASVDIAARGIMPLDAAFETLQVTYEGLGIRSKALKAITGELTEGQLRSGRAVDIIAAAVKGAGAEMRNTTSGSMANFKNSLDELGESFGAVIAPMFNKLINTIADLADGFAAMDEGTKRAIASAAGIVAIAGPVCLAVKAIGTAFTTSAGPIGAVVALIGLLTFGIMDLIGKSRAYKEGQKLVDDAIKGSLNSTQEYDAALKVLADRQVYAGDSLVDVVKRQGMVLRGVFVEGKLFFETVDKSGKVIKRISDDEKIRIDNELSQLKAQKDAILLSRKVIEEKEKVQYDAIQKRIAVEARAASAAALAAAKGAETDNKIMEIADKTEEDRQATQKKIIEDEAEWADLAIQGTRDAAMYKQQYYKDWSDEEIRKSQASAAIIKEDTDKQIQAQKEIDDAKKKAEDDEKQRIKDLIDEWQGYGQSIINILSELFSAIKAQNDRELKAEQDKLDKEHALNEKALDEKIKAENDAIDKITKDKLDAIDKELQARLYAAGLTTAATEEQYRAEIAAALAAGDTEKAAELQKALDTLLITQDFENQKKAIEDAATAAKVIKDAADLAAKEALDLATEKKKAKLQYDAALASWRMTLVMAIAGAAQAVVNGLLTQPFIPAGVAAGVLAGGLGAIQVAAVEAAKPVMPALAEGGIIPARAGGTVFRGGEGGQSEAVIPLDQLDRMLSRAGGGGGMGDLGDIHLVVRLDSRALLDTIFPATRNGTVLIDGRAIIR